MDNSDTHKEAVSRTNQGVDGYTPVALYLGNEGWNIGLELRAGSHHSALETEYFLERTFPRLERLCANDAKVLWRDDSAFDSARLLLAKAAERERWAGLGRSFDFITKWNPRRQDKDAWVAKAEAAGAFVVSRVSILNCPLDREVYGLGMGCLGLHEFHSLTVMRSKSRYVSVLGRKRFVEARRELGRLRRHEQGCWPLRASEGSCGFVTRVDGRNGMADYC
jgi:hypothetical protein